MACLLGGAATAPAAHSEEALRRNGFTLEPRSIPLSEIHKGLPERDRIPPLDQPADQAPGEAPWPDDEAIIGVVLNDEAKAYPISILVWHELVNDTLGQRPILVSYCPLCGTALVFDRQIAGKTRSFGVSGLLYLSDLLLYDRESESLWSQIASKAVTGPAMGEELKVIRSWQISWGAWRKKHPNSRVLSRSTGHTRNYGSSPYEGYADSRRLYFPAPLDDRYHPKTPTLGLRKASGTARAYPSTEVLRAGGRVQEMFDGDAIAVSYDAKRKVFDAQAPKSVDVIEGYWFAWMAFHPGSSVFVASQTESAASE